MVRNRIGDEACPLGLLMGCDPRPVSPPKAATAIVEWTDAPPTAAKTKTKVVLILTIFGRADPR